ncbi:Arginyl-tRNA synthetase [Caenispirillum salinarum AK4]|uniref:Arginine--tRNA ligase n=1 Tax=Caenispirillum salinarum AK4 TaxID=1238182 RepID=K9HM33_9PROT|nr:arginine--tRNA ligase [Caenispirillum salinarum]EKV31413.1 Arginyl-tRNA synthetase [Caenispirillum salinarum AK4]
MNLFNAFKDTILTALSALASEGKLPAGLDTSKVTAEPPRDPAHGDVATNAAMVLCKAAGMKPRDLAGLLVEKLKLVPGVTDAEIAGPGFINLRLDENAWRDVLRDILMTGTLFGDSDMGKGELVNVEYVSANPTGPMHVGHGRGAVVGDALAALLSKAGYAVTKEYYVNDAGAQVDKLADALFARYLVALEDMTQAEFDAKLAAKEIEYGGDYLVPAAEKLVAVDGRKWVDAEPEERRVALREFAIAQMMDLIREDLAVLGVHHDRFTSEKGLVDAGKVAEVLEDLEARGLIYVGVLEPPKGKTPDDWEARPQTLFKATEFGDDTDRALKKSDGSFTYFASDIAYHRDKYLRGFKQQIDVWGADHGGYVKRVAAAVKAVSGGEATFDAKLCQLVKLLDNGEPVKMSKRAGTFLTLREVVDELNDRSQGKGKDLFRFIMLTRKNDAPLEFDYSKVLEQSKDNLAFYVQYAHARARSVHRHGIEMFGAEAGDPDMLAGADLALLEDPDEMALIRLLASWPRMVEGAADAHEPHRLAYYMNDVAAGFHGLWNKGKDNARLRFLHEDNKPLSLARLALVHGVSTVIASGLAVFGVEPVEEMR